MSDQLTVIARIRTDFPEKFGLPRQSGLGSEIRGRVVFEKPYDTPDALRGIQCAVTRRPLSGGEAYLPGEAMTVAEAIDSYTCAGAYASFEEQKKGQIRPGLLADYVILGADPFAVDPKRIANIPVLATYLGGREVYCART